MITADGEADRVATAGSIPKAMAYGRASPSPESRADGEVGQRD
jgi:hypothetical protein